MSQKLYHFLKICLILLTLIVLIGLTTALAFQQAYMDNSIREAIEFHNHPSIFYPLIAAGLACLLLVAWLLKFISARLLFILCSLAYLACGTFLILNVSGQLRADAENVYKLALAFHKDTYTEFRPGGYLSLYPFQLGLVGLNMLYTSLLEDPHLIFFFNLGYVLAINGLLAKLTQRLTQKTYITKLTILMSFLFFPNFFFILFAYGTIPGLLAALAGLYLLLNFEQKRSYISLILAVICLSLATVVRNNYQIFIITVVIVYILLALFQKSWKKLGVPILIIASLIMANRGVYSYFTQRSQAEIPAGTPMLAYVYNGLSESHQPNNPGWYNGYNVQVMAVNNYDQAAALKKAKIDLKARIQTFIQSPQLALDFFSRKIRSTWTEPTFQSIWTGPHASYDQEVKTPILRSIYENGHLYQQLNLFGSIFLILIYGLNVLYLLYKLIFDRQFNHPFEFYPFIFFLGGFFFHLLWETKSQYVYIYVLLLIPTAAHMLCLPVQKFYQRKEH